jgi:hypothetical protein
MSKLEWDIIYILNKIHRYTLYNNKMYALIFTNETKSWMAIRKIYICVWNFVYLLIAYLNMALGWGFLLYQC